MKAKTDSKPSVTQGIVKMDLMYWLNKKTNEWSALCGDKQLTGSTLSTVVDAVVLNNPAFNPTTGCAVTDECDGKGGKLTVFQVAANTCEIIAPAVTSPAS